MQSKVWNSLAKYGKYGKEVKYAKQTVAVQK